jgi:hypothetical protein
MRFSIDKVGHVAYLHLSEASPGSAVKQVKCDGPHGGTVVLDFDAEGYLLGVELIGITNLLSPELLSKNDPAGQP